ncbi:MAG TPA: bifunctional diaminohydroxyphosphoribosylaminopyrimidine deaminase/5-amino-6-(5-phosphoribosylamino)uracil reductase RibD, partial [Verrucomicrobiota bacterium]|nr:bifunctional diaminohydroxyphosphoribosylaminopyrimidine deaminase/5-amino-6-(5-phosphoribosylamino)uracil reductase RibD [Verrucomicrobiota bacterium]
MRRALALARKGVGRTSPNPAVGAVIVRAGRVLGEGWHRQAGRPHAEIEALRDAARCGHEVCGATIYVTLEPCCTHGRTPPCTDALLAAGLHRVVVAATDPNPAHAGRGLELLRAAGLAVETGLLTDEAARLNEAFNHWIVRRTPFVVLKAAMTLDGRIATSAGESKWITGPAARTVAMRLRAAADAVLVGLNTVLTDDPSLTVRSRSGRPASRQPRRLVLDTRARTPLAAKLVTDAFAARTTMVVGCNAPVRRVAALRRQVDVLVAPERGGRVDLRRLMRELGRQQVTRLLVEGGGEVHGALVDAGLVHRVAFFYAPKVLG